MRDHAERVVEVEALTYTTSATKVPDKGFYALYLAEHKKLKDAEWRLENPPEPDDDPPDRW
jgi:hypothetical protein